LRDCDEFGYPLSGPDDINGYQGIDKIALDDTGDYAATAFESGLVRIYRVSMSGFGLVSTLTTGGLFNPKGTQSLSFDSTRSWLAHLRDDQLQVWSLQLGANSLLWAQTIPNAQSLVFDRTGQFLVMGTDGTLQLYDVKTASLLAEYATSVEITALTTSPDGRLLIWGDNLGIIHLWGIPMP
jgi:WD40 repeat protein